MAKVQLIKKARKAWCCQKCHAEIKVGDPYYRAEVNFGPVFIRCTSCGLKSYEATTSEYTQRVGQLVNEWVDTYGVSEDALEEIKSEIEEIKDDVESRLDEMPDQLRDSSSSGELLQERLDNLESAYDDLDAIDVDDMKREAVLLEASVYGCNMSVPYGAWMGNTIRDAFWPPRSVTTQVQDFLYDHEDFDYDEVIADDTFDNDLRDQIESSFKDTLESAIEDAIGSLEY